MASNKNTKKTRDQLIEEIMLDEPTLSMDEVAARVDAQLAGEGENDIFQEAPKSHEPAKAEAKYTEEDVLALAKRLLEQAGAKQPSTKKDDDSMVEKKVDYLLKVIEKKEGFTLPPQNFIPDDPNDHLDEPVTFYSFFQGLSICGTTRHGKTELPPFGVPIRLGNPVRKILSGPTKGTDKWLVVSYFTTYSKAQRDWLLNHEQFGNLVFSKSSDAIGRDPFFADVKSTVYREVISMTSAQVVAVSKQYGIPMSDNIEQVRDSLANYIVNQRVKEEKEKEYKLVERLSDRERKNPKEVTT